MRNITGQLSLILSLTALMACSSSPPVAEFPATADPNQEIQRVEADIKDADARQVGVFSPKNFEEASDSLDKAKEARADNKDQKKILNKVAMAEAYLKKANETASISTHLLPTVVAERQNALNAEAPKYNSKEFSDIDNDLKDVTKDIEANDTSSAVKLRDSLAGRYSDIELQSIRKAKMGEARRTQEQADKEGARKLTPGIWAWADKQISGDDAAISADRHNAMVVENASKDATASANRLLKMVRLAKNTAGQNPEELALQLEKDEMAKAQTDQELAQTNTALTAHVENAAVLAEENKKLEADVALNKEYDAARKEFTENEAEVYKQGDKLLIRLKGLSFPTNQAIITSNNYPLLAKVQKVIGDVGPGVVMIEGHTDSTGPKEVNSKLSAERAQAVQDYLKANNTIEKEKIQARGFGDSKPIATNKTRHGRAQNRRVDIIMSPEKTQSL